MLRSDLALEASVCLILVIDRLHRAVGMCIPSGDQLGSVPSDGTIPARRLTIAQSVKVVSRVAVSVVSGVRSWGVAVVVHAGKPSNPPRVVHRRSIAPRHVGDLPPGGVIAIANAIVTTGVGDRNPATTRVGDLFQPN